jgi:hypothetical protein
MKTDGLLWYAINCPLPGIHICGHLGKTKISLINEAYRPGPGIIVGQKMAEGQCGTITAHMPNRTRYN